MHNLPASLPVPIAPLPGVRAACAKYLDLAESINQLALRALVKATPNQRSNHQLIVSILYARSLTSFQSALLLAGQGMVADARSVVRSLAETTIVLKATVIDEKICDLLITRHEINQQKILNAWLTNPIEQAAMSDQHHEFLTAAQKRFAKQAAKDPINIEALAVKAGLDWLYDTVYRMSPIDAAHVSLDALEFHVVADGTATITGLRFGPTAYKLADTLVSAMNCQLVAIEAVTILYAMSEFQPEMDGHLRAVKELMEKPDQR